MVPSDNRHALMFNSVARLHLTYRIHFNIGKSCIISLRRFTGEGRLDVDTPFRLYVPSAKEANNFRLGEMRVQVCEEDSIRTHSNLKWLDLTGIYLQGLDYISQFPH